MDHVLKNKHETLGVFSAFIIFFMKMNPPQSKKIPVTNYENGAYHYVSIILPPEKEGGPPPLPRILAAITMKRTTHIYWRAIYFILIILLPRKEGG